VFESRSSSSQPLHRQNILKEVVKFIFPPIRMLERFLALSPSLKSFTEVQCRSVLINKTTVGRPDSSFEFHPSRKDERIRSNIKDFFRVISVPSCGAKARWNACVHFRVSQDVAPLAKHSRVRMAVGEIGELERKPGQARGDAGGSGEHGTKKAGSLAAAWFDARVFEGRSFRCACIKGVRRAEA